MANKESWIDIFLTDDDDMQASKLLAEKSHVFLVDCTVIPIEFLASGKN